MEFDDIWPLVLVIGIALGGVSLVGYEVVTRFGSQWLSLLNAAVSAGLTAALILLYFRQSTILRSQKELFQLEINRGVREQHTETLRERVREWHGNPDREVADNPIDQETRNVPAVARASFVSAPDTTGLAFGSEQDEFRVIPRKLENDRYLKDLLENHAPDLKDQAEFVATLQREFDSLKDEFCDQLDYTVDADKSEVGYRSTEYFDNWLFEYLILLERDYIDDFDDLESQMMNNLGDSTHPQQEGVCHVTADVGNMEQRSVVEVRSTDGAVIDWATERGDILSDVREEISEIIADIRSQHPNNQITEAAETLDQGAVAIEELEQILIEYDGKPIYDGDCEYLDEIVVTDPSAN